MMQWRDEMSVGVPELDEEHKTLISLINDYTEALEQDEGLFVTDAIFQALEQYVQYHFSREERIMEQAGYPDLEAHKRAHRALESGFEDLRDSYVLNPGGEAEQKVKRFLENWLTHHILETDMAYRDCVVAARADTRP